MLLHIEIVPDQEEDSYECRIARGLEQEQEES